MRELAAYAIILALVLAAIGLYIGRRVGEKRKRRGRYFVYVPPDSVREASGAHDE